MFCLSTEKFRWGTLRCFRKFRVSKTFMHKKGISLFSVESFLSHSAEKILRESLLCFKKFWYWKLPCIGGGSITDLESITVFSKIFCLTGPKNFVGEPFCVSENFWYGKKLWIRRRVGRECHNFPSKICCLTVPKNFVGEHFCVSENSWYRKILWIRGVEGGGVTIWNRKNIWQDRDSNTVPTASEPCCPNPTAVIYFWIKRVGNFGLKKKEKEKRLYWMNNFSCILHMWRKINS